MLRWCSGELSLLKQIVKPLLARPSSPVCVVGRRLGEAAFRSLCSHIPASCPPHRPRSPSKWPQITRATLPRAKTLTSSTVCSYLHNGLVFSGPFYIHRFLVRRCLLRENSAEHPFASDLTNSRIWRVLALRPAASPLAEWRTSPLATRGPMLCDLDGPAYSFGDLNLTLPDGHLDGFQRIGTGHLRVSAAVNGRLNLKVDLPLWNLGPHHPRSVRTIPSRPGGGPCPSLPFHKSTPTPGSPWRRSEIAI
ncbi:uncharacterized protein B0H64DRAFT_95687 [Chaetomium fimeti]|uniref:Uncharacterized protein n=1 Tax=Chaetomium fimeti TaxID=1854472 RepID=A0AAE0HMH6_9PEZI|nr:hypothetical protein B0H64DRAFT_95687 [Chaetomium fimeti]